MKRFFLMLSLLSLFCLWAPSAGEPSNDFFEMCASGSAEQVAEALKPGPDLAARDGYGDTPLIVAARSNGVEVVRLLIQAGSEVNATGSKHSTALIQAVENNPDPKVVSLLLASGAELEYVDAWTNNALSAAAVGRHPETMLPVLLAAGAKVDARDDRDFLGETVLQRVVRRNGSPEAIRLLLTGGADPAARDGKGRSLYTIAQLRDAGNELPEDLRDLFYENNKLAPADFAILCEKSPAETIRAVLSTLDNPAEFIAYADNAAVIGAAQNKDAEVLRLLLKNGADVNARNDEGRTALMYAAMNENPEAARLLLDAGAEIDAKDEKEETALMLAASAGVAGTVKNLLVAGAEVNATTSWGWCPLYSAVNNRDAEVVRLLLEAGAGAKVNVATGDGMTALMFAVGTGENTDIIRLLLDADADTEAKDSEGRTVLDHLAIRNEFEGLAALPEDLVKRLAPPIRESAGHLGMNWQVEIDYPRFGTAADKAIIAMLDASIANAFPPIDGNGESGGKLKISYQTFHPSPEVASVVFTYRRGDDDPSNAQIRIDTLNLVIASGDLLFPDSLFGDLEEALSIFSTMVPESLKAGLRRDFPDAFSDAAEVERLDQMVQSACGPDWENFLCLGFEKDGVRVYFQPGRAAPVFYGVRSAFILKQFLHPTLPNPLVWPTVQTLALVKELKDKAELNAIAGKYQLNLIGDLESGARETFLILPAMYPLTLEIFAASVNEEGELRPTGEPLARHFIGNNDAYVLRHDLSEEIPNRVICLIDPGSGDQRFWSPRRDGIEDRLILDDGFIPFFLMIPEPLPTAELGRKDLLLIQDNLLKLWQLGVDEIDGPPDNAFIIEKTLLSLLLPSADYHDANSQPNAPISAQMRELAIQKGTVEQAALELFGLPISEHSAPDGAILNKDVYYVDLSILYVDENNRYRMRKQGIRTQNVSTLTGVEAKADGSYALHGVLESYRIEGYHYPPLLWRESEFQARVRHDADSGRWRIISLLFIDQSMG